jgi:hypothetical protein
MDFEQLSSEMAALVTIQRHIATVQKHLNKFVTRLQQRGIEHDLSKLSKDEFTGFVEVNQIARLHPFGSKEYNNSLKDNKTIALHFSRNSHHPEYHIKHGVNDMTMLDWIEMVTDWKAASETYGNTSFNDALEIQRKRFRLTDAQMWLVGLIAKELE